MGEEHQHDKQNSELISPGDLRKSGMFNPIIMDIYSRRHLGHMRRLRGSAENESEKRFALSFIRKNGNPILSCRSFEYCDR